MHVTRWTALLLSATLFCLPAAAQARMLRIETIKSEPFGFEDGAGKGGMMYEIGNLIAETAGLQYENRVVPYARTVLSLREGSADMVLRFNNDELTRVAIQVAPVLPLPTMVMGRAGNDFRHLEQLRGLTVAMSRSFPGDRRVTDNPTLRLYLTDSNEHSVRMLFAGRVDAVLGSDVGLYGAASKLQHDPGDFGQPIMLEPQYFWLHLSRKTADPATVAALKTAVEQLRRDGRIEQIFRRYLNDVSQAKAGSKP